MGLTEAIHALVDGKGNVIVSVIGKRYTVAELQPKKIGARAAVINDVGMTKVERRGEWRVAESFHFRGSKGDIYRE